MSEKFENLTEDYSRRPVPEDQTVSASNVALILVGVMITVPVFLSGSEISLALGANNALLAIVSGSFLLAALGSLTAVVGAKTRLSTYMITKFSFGRLGAQVVNAVLVTTLVGWGAVTVSLFGRAAGLAVLKVFGSSFSDQLFMVIGAIIMVTSVIFGFRALERLSQLFVPVLLVLLGWMFWLVISRYGLPSITEYEGTGMDMDIALSVVVGTYIVGVILTPDLARYLHTPRDGIVASVISTAIGLPLILAVAGMSTIGSGEKDIVSLLIALGLGIPSLAVLAFATWTSNATNYYVAGLAIASMFSGIKKWKCTVFAGALSIVMAVLGIGEHMIQFLLILGLFLPPICGIYLADFFLYSGQKYHVADLLTQPAVKYQAFVAWLGGGMAGYLTSSTQMRLLGIPAIDSLVVSIALYCVFQYVAQRRRSKNN